MRHSAIYTITARAVWSPRPRLWRLWLKRFPAIGDGWRQYSLRIGPIVLHWSIISDHDDEFARMTERARAAESIRR